MGLGTAILTSFGGGKGEKLLSPPQFDRCLKIANKDSVKSMLVFGSKINVLIVSMVRTLSLPV